MATRQQVQQVAQAVRSDLNAAVSAATARFSSPAFASGDARARLENGAVSRLGQLQSRNPDLFASYARSIGAQPTLASVQSKLNGRVGDAVNNHFSGGSAPRAASASGGRSSGS